MSIPVLLAAGGEHWEAELVASAMASRDLTVVRRCVDIADAVATASSGSVRVALVSATLPGLDPDVVRRIAAHDVVVAAVDSVPTPEVLARARSLGIGRVLALTDLADVVALASATVPARALAGGGAPDGGGPATDRIGVPDGETPGLDTVHGEGGREPGVLVAVWGPHGAPGRSTLAAGMAAESAAAGRRTVLVDADVQGGSVAQALAMLDDVSGVLAAARHAAAGRLRPDTFATCLRPVAADLAVLTGLAQPQRWAGVGASAFESVLAVAQASADVVVVDLAGGLEPFDGPSGSRAEITRACLLAADRVVAVGTADPVGLARLSRAVLDLATLVLDPPDVVVNQVRSSLGWSPAEVSTTLQQVAGIVPRAFLPLDRAATDRCLVHGRTLVEGAPGSDLRRALAPIVRDVTARPGALA